MDIFLHLNPDLSANARADAINAIKNLDIGSVKFSTIAFSQQVLDEVRETNSKYLEQVKANIHFPCTYIEGDVSLDMVRQRIAKKTIHRSPMAHYVFCPASDEENEKALQAFKKRQLSFQQ